jgi:uncharacterized protein YbaP (TraB family)
MNRIRPFAAALLALALSLPAAAANFLWEVKSVTNRVYLFGTVHAAKQEWYPLPAAVEEAYADSKVLVVEADVSDKAQMEKTAPAMMYSPPDTLKDHVDAEDYERFRKLLPRYQLPERSVAQMKPFMAVSLLVFSEWARLGYLPNIGIDAYFINKAKADLKPIVEIEGVDAQVKLMDSLTDAQQKQIFRGNLKALEMGLASEQITGMVNAWQVGDPDLMLEVARKYNELVPGANEFEEKFVWSRHDSMLEKIEGYLNDTRDRHFIAVGSLHLAGPRGLVELLRKRGYIVRQL